MQILHSMLFSTTYSGSVLNLKPLCIKLNYYSFISIYLSSLSHSLLIINKHNLFFIFNFSHGFSLYFHLLSCFITSIIKFLWSFHGGSSWVLHPHEEFSDRNFFKRLGWQRSKTRLQLHRCQLWSARVRGEDWYFSAGAFWSFPRKHMLFLTSIEKSLSWVQQDSWRLPSQHHQLFASRTTQHNTYKSHRNVAGFISDEVFKVAWFVVQFLHRGVPDVVYKSHQSWSCQL